MTGTRPALLLAGLALVLTMAGCGGASRPAAAPSPPVVPGETTQGPDLAGVQLPDFVMPLIKGGVSQPDTKLTPGAVTTSDAGAVCSRGPHATVPAVSGLVQQQSFDEYGYTTRPAQGKYILDWLVPFSLGGAPVLANIWPASATGTGYYQKAQTDVILSQMVCRRELTLPQAQQALETNWYSAWLRYVVASGHI
jgi:hypothetical protein